jgi:predicted Zn-ribbon and HTH transcriptional regulator
VGIEKTKSSFRRSFFQLEDPALESVTALQSAMAFRRDLVKALSAQPRSVSSLARELGLDRRDVEDDLQHAIRSARAAGHRVVVEPARCKQCGFVFGTDRLAKPGKCPECRGSRLYEAQVSIEP